mmetsp:Transcript_27486/g.66704  ORF Transcript_27486/g.66704 Transcript_27486/m.66704 type:complete len:251 (-) Transcript_27486:274-1026(-)
MGRTYDAPMPEPSGPSTSFDGLLKMTPLDSATQKHVARVYTALTSAVAASALGAWLQVYTGNAIPPLLCTIASFGSLLYFAMLPYGLASHRKRNMVMHAAAFASGTTVGPLVTYAVSVSNFAVALALVMTATMFASFSAAALMSKRRSYMYLRGVLGSAMSTLAWVGLIGWFYPSAFFFSIQLYMGLFVFSGYVVYDTQMIVERFATHGERDYLLHALQLFQDFMAIFVRILIIILKNSEKEDNKRRRKR